MEASEARPRRRSSHNEVADNDDSNSQPVVLALPWREFSFDWKRGEFKSFDVSMPLIEGDSSVAGVGATIWDAAIILTKLLEQTQVFPTGSLKGKRVIELGAGVGMVGIALGKHMGAHSFITDLPVCLDHIQANVNLNRNYPNIDEGSIDVVELDWFKAVSHLGSSPFDYIFGADIVYVDEIMEPLVNTMKALSGPETKIYLSNQLRSRLNTERFLRIASAHFDYETVPWEAFHPKFRLDNVDVYVLRLKDKTDELPASSSPTPSSCEESAH